MSDISSLQREVHEFTVAKGWWDFPQAQRVERLLDWIIEEVEEAREAYRERGTAGWTALDDDGQVKPEGFGVELADILLLVLDLSAGTGTPLELDVTCKQGYNQLRRYRRDAAGNRVTP